MPSLPPNVILIGMPGSGKSTVGLSLARQLGYAFLDTDQHIEAGEGKPLSEVLAEASRDDFVELESNYVRRLECRGTVVSTGGSVIYSDAGMAHLRELGTVVFLDVPVEILDQRLADLPGRGVVIAAGQSIADLAGQRRPLYTRYADLAVVCGDSAPEENARAVCEALAAGCTRFGQG